MSEGTVLITPITCVQTFNDVVLAGIGGSLFLYHIRDKKKFARVEVFKQGYVMHIEPNSDQTKLIVSTGLQLCILSYPDLSPLTVQYETSNWIIDARWISNDSQIAWLKMDGQLEVSSMPIPSNILRYSCVEKRILYSGRICLDNMQNMFVLAGTVARELLIWRPNLVHTDNSLILSKLSYHKGSIFAVDYHPKQGLICSASDDRSAILYKITNHTSFINNTPDFKTLEVVVLHQVFGHSSRVFQCLILNDLFVTAGEDSRLNLWSFEGTLLRRKWQRGAPIRTVSYNNKSDSICFGSDDGSVGLMRAHPSWISVENELPASDQPRSVVMLNSGRLYSLSDEGLLYVRELTGKWSQINRHNDLKKYSVLKSSNCKTMVALGGFQGQIIIYRETIDGQLVQLCNTRTYRNESRIGSLHWFTCNLLGVAQNDMLTIYFVSGTQLHHGPTLRVKDPTCVCLANGHFLIGDRWGNVHNFNLSGQLINKLGSAHSRLGVTDIFILNRLRTNYLSVLSLGRDGHINEYAQNGHLQKIMSNKTPFSWLISMQPDCLLSFYGSHFVVSEIEENRTICEIQCGSGHRSWDITRLNDYIIFTYVKNKAICEVRFRPRDFLTECLVQGHHVGAINTLKAVNFDIQYVALLSGGEDTKLRLNTIRLTTGELKAGKWIKRHLSSIRAMDALRLDQNQFLIVTGGGRAQIIGWNVKLLNNEEVEWTEAFNHYKPEQEHGAEVRVMDVMVFKRENEFIIIAGCSNGTIRLYTVQPNQGTLDLQFELSRPCSITKMRHIRDDLIATTTTEGILEFWLIKKHNIFVFSSSFRIQLSAVTAFNHLVIDENHFLCLTGGDGCSVTLTLFKTDREEISKIDSFQNEGVHSSQVTGVHLLANGHFITCSGDQTIVIWKWTCKNQTVKFEKSLKLFCSVPDLHGLEVIDLVDVWKVILYGEGFEVRNFKKMNQDIVSF